VSHPKVAMFVKLEESSQHLNPLYIRGHIDGKPISRMLVDSGAAINLMPYSVFKKLGREDNDLVKTNLMLNGLGGNPMEAWGVISMKLTVGSRSLSHSSSLRCKVTSVIFGHNWIHTNHCILLLYTSS
jgi:hypothetical protein